MATVTPSAVAKLWRKDVPREARYAGLRDLLEEDASDNRDSLTVKTTPRDCTTKELDEHLPDYAPSIVGALLQDLRASNDRAAAECLSLLVRVAGRRPSKLASSLVEAGLTRQALSRAALDAARTSLQNNELDAASAALEAYACGPSKGPEPAEYASRWCVVACAALKKNDSRLETAALSVLDAVVRRSTTDPAYALCAFKSSKAGERSFHSPTQVDDDGYWDCALASRCADPRPYVARAVAASLRRAASTLRRGRPLSDWLSQRTLTELLIPAWKDQLRNGTDVCDSIGALLDCCHPSPLFNGDAKAAKALVPLLSECRNKATNALTQDKDSTPLKQFFTAWDAVFRCLRGVDDERWCRAARQHGKMLARPYAAAYVRAAQSGSYGLELITAACDEPRALERVLKSLGKAFSDDVDENNMAALCERAPAPLLARSLAKLLRRCEEAYVVKATIVVLEHCLAKHCDRHGICDAVRKLARRRIGRDKLRKIVCSAGGDILGAYIDEGVDGFDLIAAAKSGDVSFAARVEGTSLLKALEKAEASEDRETLLIAWRAHPKDYARLWAWPLLSAIDTNQTTGLDEADNWGQNLARVGRRKSGDSVEAVAVVTQVRETLEDATQEVSAETLAAACCFCAALLDASGYDAVGLPRAVADAAYILKRTVAVDGKFGDLADSIGVALARNDSVDLCTDVCKAIQECVPKLLERDIAFVGNVLDALDGKADRLTEAAAPLLAASYNDDRVARRADDAWSRIKPEDPAKQPADVRVACGAFVRRGGRQQPLTLGKRSVEAPTPAPKKLKTPISGVSGDARLSYALAEVGTQSSQDLTQEPRRRANIKGDYALANSQTDLPAAWAARLDKAPSQSQG
ncbi:unnamed protein product [Pelagomonas calceolata]|uniref:Uncharacterized protein n=1 Tax=Pelagomonas calceolata TaxID=35677 RepID=A0A8J2SVY1_9STRA|nr:unnamed protein product [Pelagomonas calceolata]|mmetsp:Transcript_6714/g.18883  ORF Transcript_6714/g.18883 Transcript_6714/m.18883 type:complete len:866 (-) Transcript_6714:27-2624(-)